MISNFNNYSNLDYYKYNSMFPRQKYSPFVNTNDRKNDTINESLTNRKHDIVAKNEPTTFVAQLNETEIKKCNEQSCDLKVTNGNLHYPFASFWGIEDGWW